MIGEKIKQAIAANEKVLKAEYNLENAIFSIIEEYQQTQEDFCVHFNDQSGYPLFRDELNDEQICYEYVKMRGGELYIKLSSHVDENWFCPYEYGTLDYNGLLSCLIGICDYEEK